MSKILLISGSLPPIDCGVGFYTDRLSRELAAAGLDFEILSTVGVNDKLPAPLKTVPNWKISSLPKMLRAIKQSGAGIVHIEYPAVGYRRQLGINLLPYALRLFKPKLKLIVTLHEYSQSRVFGRIRNKITVWPAHRIVVSNQVDKRSLGHRATLIPVGSNFDPIARRPEVYKKILRDHGLDQTKQTIVFFGYAFPAKKLEILLEAMEEPELNTYQLLIFPEIDNKSTYGRRLKSKIAGINEKRPRIAVQEFLDDAKASAALQECKYFVMPNDQPLSPKSTTAIAAVENGLVVISRDAHKAGGTDPFVHMKNCYLLNKVNPKSIAEAIVHLDTTPTELSTIRRGANELKKYFSWDNIVRQHLKIYKELSDG